MWPSKKKAFKKKKHKMSSVTVVLLKKFQASLPKGKQRRELSAGGRIRDIKFHRQMTTLEVKNVVMEGFKSVMKKKSFVVLETEGGSILARASYQGLKL